MSVLEIAEFSLAPGVSEADFLATRPAVEAFLRQRPGFLSLRLLRDGPRWMDVAEWQDMASAHAAAEALPTEASLAPFLAALDPSSISMRHLEVVGRS